PETATLSLHDALPISSPSSPWPCGCPTAFAGDWRSPAPDRPGRRVDAPGSLSLRKTQPSSGKPAPCINPANGLHRPGQQRRKLVARDDRVAAGVDVSAYPAPGRQTRRAPYLLRPAKTQLAKRPGELPGQHCPGWHDDISVAGQVDIDVGDMHDQDPSFLPHMIPIA